jgi:hypothetical protein
LKNKYEDLDEGEEQQRNPKYIAIESNETKEKK